MLFDNIENMQELERNARDELGQIQQTVVEMRRELETLKRGQ